MPEMTFTTVRIYLCMATANCLFWLYDYILQWRIENIFRLTLKVSSVHMCLCLCLFCEWWAGLEWKWFCRGCCLNYTQAVFMCVQLCGLAEVRDLLHSTPRGLLLKTKSNTADSAPVLHYQLTHTEVPRLRATLHPGPPLWSGRIEAVWRGTSPGSWWGIRRHWLSLRRTQYITFPKMIHHESWEK